MGINTGLILLNIFIICVISIIIVKLYYRNHEEADTDIKLFKSTGSFFSKKRHNETNEIITQSEKNKSYETVNSYFKNGEISNARNELDHEYKYSNIPPSNSNPYAVANDYNQYYKKEGDTMSQNNQNTTFGENTNAKDIEKEDIRKKIDEIDNDKLVTNDQSTQKETYTEIAEAQPKTTDKELKDLFTIDELIKESKRKTQTIEKPEETPDEKEISSPLTDEERKTIKNNIKNLEDEKETTNTSKTEIIDGVIKSESPINSPILKTPTKSETSMDEVIKESVEKKIESITDDIDHSTQKETYTEIAEAQPKTIDQPLKNDLFEKSSEIEINGTHQDIDSYVDDEDYVDLDYRKDLTRITNKVKNSKIFNDVKNKLTLDTEEDNPSVDEEFLRNVRSYDDVIIPEREEEYETTSPQIETAKDLHIKAPKKEAVNLKINNNDTTLKKDDEIIFKYNGETYSSKVFGINGDDITVKFRGQYITIKPTDVNKIF